MAIASDQVADIFWQALHTPDDERRREYLDDVCRDAPAIRARVDQLLTVQSRMGEFLETSFSLDEQKGDVELTSPEPLETLGSMIGRYRLLERLGEGGMGNVFVAEQLEPVRRRAALKVLKPGMDTRQVIARFEAERQALALMTHPNIATVLDAGSTIAGRPYFVMELVLGVPITEYCTQQNLSIRERLGLFQIVCQAVQHAHQKGIIHRDLKPSNVLVSQADPPCVKIIDFGIAKAIGQPLTGAADNTVCGQMVGTPLYMSPEQAAMGVADIDTRTDVYSLGSLLFELLSDSTPIERELLQGVGIDEMRRVICQVEPEAVSVRIQRIRRRGVPPGTSSFQVAPELDWIVAKALEKDRALRYESASALAADIQCFLEDRPVSVRNASMSYRLRKWSRRHPAGTTFLVLALAGAVILTVVGGYYHQRLTAALLKAQRLQVESLKRERNLRAALYVSEIRLAGKAWEAGDRDGAWLHLQRVEASQAGRDLTGFEWSYLRSSCLARRRTLTRHAAPILNADVSPDKRLVASGDAAGTVKLSEFATGRELRVWNYGPREVTAVCFSPDGQLLATGGQDETIRLWDVADGSERACFRGHDGTVCSIAWSSDGKQLASGGRDYTVRIWSRDRLEPIATLPRQRDVVRCVAWSSDGEVLATAVRKDCVQLWDTRTWQLRKSISDGGWDDILALAFSPDSHRLAAGGYSRQIYVMTNPLVDQSSTAEIDVPYRVWSLRFSPDGGLLVAGLACGLIFPVDVTSSEGALSPRPAIQEGDGGVRAVAFAEGGRTLVTAHENEQALYAQPAALGGIRSYRFSPPCFDVGLPPTRALVRNDEGSLDAVPFPSETGGAAAPATKRPVVNAAVVSPAGDCVAAIVGAEVHLLNSQTLAPIWMASTTEVALRTLRFSLDGKWLAASGESTAVWLLDAGSGTLRHKLVGHPDNTVRSDFSPDGVLLATASSNGRHALLWDVKRGTRVAELAVEQGVTALIFSPDGGTLAIGTYAQGVQLWDVPSRRRIGTLRGHVGSLRAVVFSPDGRCLVTAGDDGTARLWHVASQEELFVLVRRSVPLHWIKFLSPHQLAIGTAPYGDPSSPANDVILCGNREL